MAIICVFMKQLTLDNKTTDVKKLKAFGFKEFSGGLKYEKPIVGGQFLLTVFADQKGRYFTEVIDTETGEEYVLHLVGGAQGEFVGKVRTEYDEVIADFERTCFLNGAVLGEYAQKIIAYAVEKYGESEEYLWEKFPDNAIIRRKDNKKWYAALLTVKADRLGLEVDKIKQVIDLRMPKGASAFIDNVKYFPGYHMNKQSWFTVCLDGSVPIDEIIPLLDKSRALTERK